MVLQLGFSDSFLDQLIESMEMETSYPWGCPPFVLVVLEGYNLGLKLFVEQYQLLWLLKDDLAVDGHLLRSLLDFTCCFFICSLIT